MARPRENDGAVFKRKESKVWWMRYRDRDGTRRMETTNSTSWEEAQRQLRERLTARDNNSLGIIRKGKQLSFNEWADVFLTNYSQPPIRAEKTHEANETALKTLRAAFGELKLTDIDADVVESHLRNRLQAKRHVRRRSGVVEAGTLKATTVHQEFRVLRRILNVAVKKRLLHTNPSLVWNSRLWSRGFSGRTT